MKAIVKKTDTPGPAPPIQDLLPEFGNALGGVLSATQALLSGADEDPALRRDFLKGMEEKLFYLRFLLDNWILLSSLRKLRLQPRAEPHVEAGWLANFFSDQQHSGSGKNFRWRISLPDQFPSLQSNQLLTARALDNILFNSKMLSPPGSIISVRSRWSDQKAALLLEICDAGPPIPEGAISGLSEGRSNAADNPRLAHGLGLGLTFSHRLIQKLGGALTTQPVGNGCCFTLTLPSQG